MARIKAFLSALLIAMIVFGGLALIETSADAQPATVTQLWNAACDRSEVNSPVLAGGFVYFTSQNSASATTTLYCLDASSGIQIWKSTGRFYTFTVANGCVYIGSATDGKPVEGHPTLLGVVYCLNASNGGQLWNYSYGTGFGTPVVDGGVVYVGGQNYTWWNGIGNGLLYAFDALTGTIIWSYIGPQGTRFDLNSPVLAGGYVYTATNVIYAFNSSSGERIWNYTTPGRLGSLIAMGDNVYVSCNYFNSTNENAYAGSILALRDQDGSLIWNYTSGPVGSFTFADDTVYASGSGFVYALDASAGKVIWNYATERNMGTTFFVNGYLYAGSSAGVFCFNAFNGTLFWNFDKFDHSDSSFTVPTYADGVIYVGWNGPMFFSHITQHSFYAVIASSGEQLWNYTLGYTINSYPAAANGTVYIGASFVTPENPDLEGTGAVIALNSTVASLPLPTLYPPPSTPEVPQNNQTNWALYGTIALVVAVLFVGALAAFSVMKKKKKPPTS